MADSLLGNPALHYLHPRQGADSTSEEARVRAIEAFNDGASALEAYVLSTADSSKAGALLNEAAERFEEALEAAPFDEEIRYWLGHVYELHRIRWIAFARTRRARVGPQRSEFHEFCTCTPDMLWHLFRHRTGRKSTQLPRAELLVMY